LPNESRTSKFRRFLVERVPFGVRLRLGSTPRGRGTEVGVDREGPQRQSNLNNKKKNNFLFLKQSLGVGDWNVHRNVLKANNPSFRAGPFGHTTNLRYPPGRAKKRKNLAWGKKKGPVDEGVFLTRDKINRAGL